MMSMRLCATSSEFKKVKTMKESHRRDMNRCFGANWEYSTKVSLAPTTGIS
jgi:hypothetical protein